MCVLLCVSCTKLISKLYSYESILLPPPKTHRAQGLFPKKQAVLTLLRTCTAFHLLLGNRRHVTTTEMFPPNPPHVPAGASLIRIAFRCQLMAVAITLTSHLHQPNLKAIQIFLLSIDEYFHLR